MAGRLGTIANGYFLDQCLSRSPADSQEIISIPRCPELMAQLSLPLTKRTSTGLVLIESKRDMAARGVKSPDYADSLALTEAAAGVNWGLITQAASATLERRRMDDARGRILQVPRGKTPPV